ncbi:hypothetical protein GCM10008908_18520 [Clostridium subterminale]|uniref:Transposase n=1 Tax=Clostridium subterminale TaxID=1550 RepID=A0ABN1KNV9_CLOSU
MKSTNQDMVLWEQRIKERATSGLSVSEWCKINSVKKNRYYYWSSKINKMQVSDDTMEFVEVTSIISEEHEDKLIQNHVADFQIFFKDIQVTVPSNFDKDSLAGLMKVLQQL